MTADTPLELRVVPVQGEGDLASALAIREIVFIEEQSVPEALERDADDARAFHLLVYDGKHAIGTGRLVMLDTPPKSERGRWAQIGRMAVLASWRSRGAGKALMVALEEEARKRKVDGIMLHAQLHVREFYQAMGYHDASPIFDEAGIPHVEMRKLMWMMSRGDGGGEVF